MRTWEKLSQLSVAKTTSIDGNAKTQSSECFFQSSKSKFSRFSWRTSKVAKNAFGKAAHAIVEQFIFNNWTKMPPHLKKLMNQAHLENGTYEQIVTNREEELEQNSFEPPIEIQMNNASQHATTTNADRIRPKSHQCKKPGHYRNRCRQLKKKKLKALKLVPKTKTVVPINLNPLTAKNSN